MTATQVRVKVPTKALREHTIGLLGSTAVITVSRGESWGHSRILTIFENGQVVLLLDLASYEGH